MKRFRFSLQPLYALRQRQEQLALEEYSAALAAQRQVNERLRVATNDCEQAWAMNRERLQMATPALELLQIKDFCRVCEERKRDCEVAVRQAQRVTDIAWRKLVVARQRREAVEKYKKRQWSRYEYARQREEQKTLDEVAHRQFAGAMTWNWNESSERDLS